MTVNGQCRSYYFICCVQESEGKYNDEYLDKLIEDEKGDYEVLTEDGYLHIIEERIEIDTVKEEIRL